MAMFAATFQSADTNSDGLLDGAEFKDFMGKMAANATAAGIPTQGPDSVEEEMQGKVYAFFNAQTEGTDGISTADFFAGQQKVSAAIKAAMGQ